MPRPSVSAPLWLKLTRSGNALTGYYSTDGVNWIQVGMTTTVDLRAAVLAGLAVCSGDNNHLGTAVFSNVSLM